jgi:hypothetical protein
MFLIKIMAECPIYEQKVKGMAIIAEDASQLAD